MDKESYRKEYSSITVKHDTRKKIAMLRVQHGFKSADEVIKYLLEKGNEHVKGNSKE